MCALEQQRSVNEGQSAGLLQRKVKVVKDKRTVLGGVPFFIHNRGFRAPHHPKEKDFPRLCRGLGANWTINGWMDSWMVP